jgi:hypothetical protein
LIILLPWRLATSPGRPWFCHQLESLQTTLGAKQEATNKLTFAFDKPTKKSRPMNQRASHGNLAAGYIWDHIIIVLCAVLMDFLEFLRLNSVVLFHWNKSVLLIKRELHRKFCNVFVFFSEFQFT